MNTASCHGVGGGGLNWPPHPLSAFKNNQLWFHQFSHSTEAEGVLRPIQRRRLILKKKNGFMGKTGKVHFHWFSNAYGNSVPLVCWEVFLRLWKPLGIIYCFRFESNGEKTMLRKKNQPVRANVGQMVRRKLNWINSLGPSSSQKIRGHDRLLTFKTE